MSNPAWEISEPNVFYEFILVHVAPGKTYQYDLGWEPVSASTMSPPYRGNAVHWVLLRRRFTQQQHGSQA
jgi:hypothetical protein